MRGWWERRNGRYDSIHWAPCQRGLSRALPVVKIFLPKHCSLLLNLEKFVSGYDLVPKICSSFRRAGARHASQNRLANLGRDG